MSQTITAEEVCQWVVVNARRVQQLRLLTKKDINRRLPIHRVSLQNLLSGHWERCRTTKGIQSAVWVLVSLCNALGMTPAELFSRPDDMSLLKQDGRKAAREIIRKKAKLKQTQEQAEMQALLESLGLDS